MKRIATSNAVADLFGPGKPGFGAGNPSAGVRPTYFSADWCNDVQEEICALPEVLGIVIDGSTRNMLATAIQTLVQRSMGSFSTLIGIANPMALTSQNIGNIVGLNLSAGAGYQVTLPPSNPANAPSGSAIGFFHNALAGSFTVAANGADQIVIGGVGNASIALNPGQFIFLVANGGGYWYPISTNIYGFTAPQFDSSTNLATMGAVQRALGNFRSLTGIAAATTLGSQHAGQLIGLNLNAGAGYQVTLPPSNAANAPAGSGIGLFHNASSSSFTIAGNGTNKIVIAGSSLASVGLNPGQFLFLVSDGNGNWYPISTNIYGYTSPQFDNTTNLVTTAWANRRGIQASGITTVTATGNLSAANAGGTVVGNSASAITQTLPAASGFPSGARIEFLNINTGTMTVARNGTDTITVNGGGTVTSLAMSSGDTLTLESNGNNGWYAVGGSAQLQYATALASLRGGSGYQKLPGGVVIQWGSYTSVANGTTAALNFPIAFPNNCSTVHPSASNNSVAAAMSAAIVSASQFTITSAYSTAQNTFVIAIGW